MTLMTYLTIVPPWTKTSMTLRQRPFLLEDGNTSYALLSKDCTLAFPLCTRLQYVAPSACNGSTIPSSWQAVVFQHLSLLPGMSDNPPTNARSRKTRILLSPEAAAVPLVAILPQRH